MIPVHLTNLEKRKGYFIEFETIHNEVSKYIYEPAENDWIDHEAGMSEQQVENEWLSPNTKHKYLAKYVQSHNVKNPNDINSKVYTFDIMPINGDKFNLKIMFKRLRHVYEKSLSLLDISQDRFYTLLSNFEFDEFSRNVKNNIPIRIKIAQQFLYFDQGSQAKKMYPRNEQLVNVLLYLFSGTDKPIKQYYKFHNSIVKKSNEDIFRYISEFYSIKLHPVTEKLSILSKILKLRNRNKGEK